MSLEYEKFLQAGSLRIHCCICQEYIDSNKRDATILHTKCGNVSHTACLELWEGCNEYICPGCGGYFVTCKPQKLNINLVTSSMISDERINSLIKTLNELNLQLQNSGDIEDKVQKIRLLCKVYHEVTNFFQQH